MRGKNYWVLLLLMLCGVVIGGFVGDLTKTISWLSWLNTGQSFGFDTPVIVNLGILVITFGIHIKVTMAGIIGMAAALIAYRLI